MQAHSMRYYRHVLATVLSMVAIMIAGISHAAPYAAMVMDARSGEVIFARNHDTKLHPASLTKMMTLYVAFEAIKHGEVTLDTQFTVSRNATQAACVCLGLRAGQKISLRYLIRAAALRSANDAAVVIAEGISGSVEAFADRMTRTARAMGMDNTSFRNPHGLTQAGHLSTARDMSILGRQLYFDYPQYFNIFSRRSDHAGVATVPNTNRRFLDAYSGADGIKTGYTRAAGFNLTASARRGERHIIATMFGGSSTAARNAHVAELLDIGFSRAAARVAVRAPGTPAYQGRGTMAVAQAPTRNGDDDPSAAAKTIRLQTAVRTSLRPEPRPTSSPDDAILMAVRESVDSAVSGLAVSAAVADAETRVTDASEADSADTDVASLAPDALVAPPPPRPEDVAQSDAASDVSLDAALAAGFTIADPDEIAQLDTSDSAAPDDDVAATEETAESAPEDVVLMAETTDTATQDSTPAPQQIADAAQNSADTDAQFMASDHADLSDDGEVTWIGASESMLAEAASEDDLIRNEDGALRTAALNTPQERAAPQANSGMILTSTPAQPRSPDVTPQALASAIEANLGESEPGSGPEVVARLSTSDGGRLWGVSLGEFNSRNAAERSLITVKMAEAAALGNGVSRIRQGSGRFEATVAGLTQTEAERACLRLTARSMDCSIAQP